MLLTLSNRLTPTELWELCRDAAGIAVRAPQYDAAARDDCTADLFSDAAADMLSRVPAETGRPSEVLAYITALQRDSNLAALASMPDADDASYTIIALKNRALNWRRKRDADRARDALHAGGKSGASKPAPDRQPPARYLAAGARQNRATGERAAAKVCELLKLPTGRDVLTEVRRTAMIVETITVREHSGEFLLAYQWARDIDAAAAATELGISHAAYRKRTSRAAATVRAHFSLEALCTALCGAPVPVADMSAAAAAAAEAPTAARATLAYIDAALAAEVDWTFSLTDASREARNRTRMLADLKSAEHWREYIGEDRPMRAQSADDARALCTVSETAPDTEAPARRAAVLAGRDADREALRARRRVASAIEASTGRMSKRAHGRTAGKAPEKWADRATRLGER